MTKAQIPWNSNRHVKEKQKTHGSHVYFFDSWLGNFGERSFYQKNVDNTVKAVNEASITLNPTHGIKLKRNIFWISLLHVFRGLNGYYKHNVYQDYNRKLGNFFNIIGCSCKVKKQWQHQQNQIENFIHSVSFLFIRGVYESIGNKKNKFLGFLDYSLRYMQ